ncbi:MAG TPA: hypothetical protein VJQ09_04805 [Candidatus Limnocylindria bacterium]|nr:hypothetical protein [Candidatus Limnocylindria bacterium]
MLPPDGRNDVPTGGGEARGKNKKKKSKEELERELRKKGLAAPVQPMTFEVIKPKRKEKDW